MAADRAALPHRRRCSSPVASPQEEAHMCKLFPIRVCASRLVLRGIVAACAVLVLTQSASAQTFEYRPRSGPLAEFREEIRAGRSLNRPFARDLSIGERIQAARDRRMTVEEVNALKVQRDERELGLGRLRKML